MDFFKKLQETGIKNCSIEVKYAEDGRLTVAIVPKSKSEDAALKTLKPLLLTDTVENIDSGFFEAIAGPLNETQKMFTNVESYEAQQQEAEKSTKEFKDKKDKLDKAISSLKKIIDAKDFNPLKDKKAAIKAADAVLELDKDNAIAKKAKSDILAKTSGGLFDEIAEEDNFDEEEHENSFVEDEEEQEEE